MGTSLQNKTKVMGKLGLLILALAFKANQITAVGLVEYRASAACEWDYTNDGANWNTDCTDTAPVGCNHNKQSPIDIDETESTYNDTAFTGGDHIELGPDYFDVIEGEFQRKGFTIQFTKNAGWSDSSTSKNWLKHKTLNSDSAGANVTGTPLVADSKFLLWQFHFHWGKDDTQGSEHTVNGREFPMEVHFVHVNAKYAADLENGVNSDALTNADGLLVVGFFFEVSDSFSDYKLAREFSPTRNAARYIYNQEVKESKCNDKVKSTHKFRNHKKWFQHSQVTDKHWHYQGGLTTPTCNEVVTWVVAQEYLKVTPRDLTHLRKMEDDEGNAIEHNFRAPQNLNGRTIYNMGPSQGP